MPKPFHPVEGFTFREAAGDVIEQFREAASASLEGTGEVASIRAVEGIHGDEAPIQAISFGLRSTGDADEFALFGRLIESMAAGLGASWAPALDGQGYKAETPATTAIILPWGTDPDGSTVFLLVRGDRASSVEALAEGLAG